LAIRGMYVKIWQSVKSWVPGVTTVAESLLTGRSNNVTLFDDGLRGRVLVLR